MRICKPELCFVVRVAVGEGGGEDVTMVHASADAVCCTCGGGGTGYEAMDVNPLTPPTWQAVRELVERAEASARSSIVHGGERLTILGSRHWDFSPLYPCTSGGR